MQAVSAHVDTFRSHLPHLWTPPPTSLCIWGDCRAQKPLRLDKSNHQPDRISLELCVTRFDPAALSEMLYLLTIRRPERCCCSCFCLHWYRLMTLSEHFDAEQDTVTKCSVHFEFWTRLSVSCFFLFSPSPRTWRCSGPSWCSHLSSIINHSDSLPEKIVQS